MVTIVEIVEIIALVFLGAITILAPLKHKTTPPEIPPPATPYSPLSFCVAAAKRWLTDNVLVDIKEDYRIQFLNASVNTRKGACCVYEITYGIKTHADPTDVSNTWKNWSYYKIYVNNEGDVVEVK